MRSIRVDLDKIDRVVNMVGELVITQSMLTQQMDETLRSQYQELVRGLEVLAQTTRGLQDSVMAIRAPWPADAAPVPDPTTPSR